MHVVVVSSFVHSDEQIHERSDIDEELVASLQTFVCRDMNITEVSFEIRTVQRFLFPSQVEIVCDVQGIDFLLIFFRCPGKLATAVKEAVSYASSVFRFHSAQFAEMHDRFEFKIHMRILSNY